MRTRVLAVLVIALALSGCSQNSTSLPPPGPSHLYVSDFSAGFAVYSLPATAASSPVASQSIPGGGGDVALDANGEFYATTPDEVLAFMPPVASSSAPTLTIGPIAGAANLIGIAFDPTGGLYVADAFSHQIFFFARPFGSATPTTTFTGTPPFIPTTITFDGAGNLYVSNFSASAVDVFKPPFTAGVNTPTAMIALTKAAPQGIKLDSGGRLVVGLVDGELAVFNPPFATGSTPAFYVAAPTINGGTATFPGGETMDSSDNFYVPYGSAAGANAGIAVFAAPLGPASLPIFSFRSGLIEPNGTAFGAR